MTSTTPRGSDTICAEEGNVVMAAGTWAWIPKAQYVPDQRNSDSITCRTGMSLGQPEMNKKKNHTFSGFIHFLIPSSANLHEDFASDI